MSRPTRRDALRSATLVGLWAGLGTVGGCGVRLEDDAPDVPFLPRRTPVPAEASREAESTPPSAAKVEQSAKTEM